VVVVTARSRPEGAEQVLRTIGLDELVDLVVVSPAAAVREKADALRACRAAGYIADTESDAEAARQAGVPFVAVSTGQRSAEFLAARGCLVAVSLRAGWDLLSRTIGRAEEAV
jgi:phosphoglycolate phosphatase-like HAD superfamily hydrolase